MQAGAESPPLCSRGQRDAKELLEYYIKMFHAEYLGMLHQYQFFIDDGQAKKLLEVYNYKWN